MFHATGVDTSPNDIPEWAIKLTAAGAVVIVSIICVASSKMGTRVAGVFMVVKVKLHSCFIAPDIKSRCMSRLLH